jgi:hypothetical protein
MPTNLLIGYPDIPLASESATMSRAASSLYPYTNLFGGNKADLMYVDTPATGDTRLTFSLPSGVTRAANFVYLARANLLKQDAVATITVRAGTTTDYATAATIRTYSSFGSTALYGPNADDFIDSFTTSSAYRYWFVNYNSTAASSFAHAKLFFGRAFDIGIDPNAEATITRVRAGGAQRRAIYSFEFSWSGVSYAKAVEMYESIYRLRRHMPLVLFTSSWHDILMGNRVIFCRLLDMSMPPRVTDYCDVSATFEELI